LVFRQSGKQADFHDTYADKVLRISTTTVPNLRTITANEIAAVAVLSSKICKGCLMPLFASDPETEMRLARQTDLITGDISYEDTRTMMTHGRTAARATLNITNQLLAAKAQGRRPVLVSMGTNGIPNNWQRFSEFIRQFRDQYGQLDGIVHLNAEEMCVASRAGNLLALCPITFKEESFGVYTSADFVSYHEG
jgi:hypothetical protein